MSTIAEFAKGKVVGTLVVLVGSALGTLNLALDKGQETIAERIERLEAYYASVAASTPGEEAVRQEISDKVDELLARFNELEEAVAE